ncbi:MAG: SET domain-containing protein-lysine N-methyltransferase [Bacteroidia bacterium]
MTYAIDAAELNYLFVTDSQIPFAGKGLYTAIAIYKDEVISLFKGEKLSHKEATKRASNSEDGYFIVMPDGSILDSMKVKCFAKYANDSAGFIKTKFRINSRITLDDNHKVCIAASRDILKGEEIFCSYGKAYWEKFGQRKK